MHFHLPKPLQGWREFAGEVGIIVIGVLIALGAEQVVETIHWRSQAHETEQTLRAEIQDSLNSVAQRRTLDGCLRRQLIALRDAAIGRGPLPQGTAPGDGSRVIPDAYATPWRAWAQGSWQSAIASGVLNHVPPNRLSAYSQAYKAIEDLDGIVRQERLTKGSLAPLALGPPAAATASTVLTAVTNLDRNRADMLVAGGDLIAAAAALGIKPDVRKTQSQVAIFKQRYPVCR
jgi:hypothetical protein